VGGFQCSDRSRVAKAPGSSPGRDIPAVVRKISDLVWLPIVDTDRTVCIAPPPEVSVGEKGTWIDDPGPLFCGRGQDSGALVRIC